MCVLQQHELDALGEVVPGVSRQQLQSRGPARGDLEANAGRRHARRRNLGGSKAQEGVIYHEEFNQSASAVTVKQVAGVTQRPPPNPPCRDTSRK